MHHATLRRSAVLRHFGGSPNPQKHFLRRRRVIGLLGAGHEQSTWRRWTTQAFVRTEEIAYVYREQERDAVCDAHVCLIGAQLDSPPCAELPDTSLQLSTQNLIVSHVVVITATEVIPKPTSPHPAPPLDTFSRPSGASSKLPLLALNRPPQANTILTRCLLPRPDPTNSMVLN